MQSSSSYSPLSTITFKVLDWNISSVKQATYEQIRQTQPHILAFQETRGHIFNNTPSYNYINGPRKSDKGGGLVIGIAREFNFRQLNDIFPETLKETNLELLAVQVFHKLFDVIIINIYIPIYNKFGKRNLKKLQDWAKDISQRISGKRIIITGDFNTNHIPIPFFKHVNE